MTEALPVANFSDMDGFRTIVFDTAKVPEEVWRETQLVHRESLIARLPIADQERADYLVRWGDFQSYRDSRVDPNVLVGHEWRGDQLFRRPKLAAVYDHSNQLVGAAITADNSSATRFPKPLRPVEYWAKMVIKPGLSIPIFGNKRYDHLREVFTHPDAQGGKLENELGQRIVSGIALAAIYYSLDEVYQQQELAAYIVEGDEADSELADIASILGMHGGQPNPHNLPGFKKERSLIRVQKQAGEVTARIIHMPGARKAIVRKPLGAMSVERLTVKTSRKTEKQERMKVRRDSWRQVNGHSTEQK